MKNLLFIDNHKPTLALLFEVYIDDYNVFTCQDGFSAKRVVRTHNVDVILVDLFLGPCGNGIAVARTLKAAYPQARIILMGSMDEFTLRRWKPSEFALLSKIDLLLGPQNRKTANALSGFCN